MEKELIKKVVFSGMEAEGATIGVVLWMTRFFDVHLESGKIKKNVRADRIIEINGKFYLKGLKLWKKK